MSGVNAAARWVAGCGMKVQPYCIIKHLGMNKIYLTFFLTFLTFSQNFNDFFFYIIYGFSLLFLDIYSPWENYVEAHVKEVLYFYCF